MHASQVRLRFGVRTPQSGRQLDEIRTCWQAADGLGFDTAWLSDHFIGVGGGARGLVTPVDTPAAEAWTLLSALLVSTQRIRGGIMVSGNTFRDPVLVAHMARTVDHLSNGRLEFGLGLGWNEPEHRMFGWQLPPVAERAVWFDEACVLMKRLWTEPSVTFDGTRYHLADAVLEPKPIQKPYPHFVVGASGLKYALRATALHADEWNDRALDVDTYRVRADALAGHCRAIKRAPEEIERSALFHVQPASRDARTLVAHVTDFIGLGVNHIIFQPSGACTDTLLAWLWHEIVPAIRDRAGR